MTLLHYLIVQIQQKNALVIIAANLITKMELKNVSVIPVLLPNRNVNGVQRKKYVMIQTVFVKDKNAVSLLDRF